MTDLARIQFTPPPILGDDPVAWAQDIERYLAQQFDLVQQLLGGSLRWQNLRSALISGTFPAAKDTSKTFPHNLGKIPEFYIPNVEATLVMIYATPADKALWTTSTIDLRSSLASAGFTALVM